MVSDTLSITAWLNTLSAELTKAVFDTNAVPHGNQNLPLHPPLALYFKLIGIIEQKLLKAGLQRPSLERQKSAYEMC